MRPLSVLRAGLVLPLVLALTPAPEAVPVPVLASGNIELVTTIPDVTAISTAFDPTRPFMYVNTLTGVTAYDVSDPAAPTEVGRLAMPHFENEGMDVGQRDGKTFVLVGLDVFAAGASTADGVREDGSYLIVVDVTDPATPTIVSEIDTATSTHTVQCVTTSCEYAYTSGIYEDEFQVVDLADITAPRILDGVRKASIGGSHQWTRDEAGVLWGASWDGAAALDVSDPTQPLTAAATNKQGIRGRGAGDYAGINDFVLHNVERPNASAFTVDEETGISGSRDDASLEDGNVLLVTEEDYDSPVCGGGAGEGTFSTWYVPSVDAEVFAEEFPEAKAGDGAIEPLDTWNTEILDSGQRTVAGALCSAHYFTTHQDGFVAQAWYQQGTRILDVRDPRDIKQVGYFFTGHSETWHAYWVPARDAAGAIDGEQKTDLIYTNDAARGIDVLRVTLPETAPAGTRAVTAPILPQWLATEVVTVTAPSPQLGYACRIG